MKLQPIFSNHILYIFLPELFLKRIKNSEIFGKKPKLYQLYRNSKNKVLPSQRWRQSCVSEEDCCYIVAPI